MNARINMVTLGVNDLLKSLHFYENVVGWKKSKASQENVAFFKLNGILLGLYPRHLLAEDATVPAEGSGFSGFSLSYNAKSEKEVDDVIASIEKGGGTIVKKPQKVFWGGYSSYFKDPDGHLFEVAYNPYWAFDENDNVIID